jgi:F0F1-type ATP synthase epsilon subunit
MKGCLCWRSSILILAALLAFLFSAQGVVEAFAATSTGTMVLSVNMPIAEVDVAVTAVTGTGFSTLADQDVAVAAGVVSVKSNSSSAATDAANEATDAANAATDAANAAAEAADAATAAAQDAADAVAALSTEVATLIAALKAQITSLTNLVIKIQKKVKA